MLVVAALSLFSASVAAVTVWITLPRQQHHRAGASLLWNGYRNTAHLAIPPTISTNLCDTRSGSTDENAVAMSTKKGQLPSSIIDFTRYELMPIPDRPKAETHAIYGALLKANCIERYEVYRARRQSQIADAITASAEALPNVVAVVTVGSHLDGHSQIVHGGIIALIVDDILGFGYDAVLMDEKESLGGKNDGIINDYTDVIAVTANLNINFRAPISSGSTFVVEASLISDIDKQERRTDQNKFHWDVQVKSPDRSLTYCQATSLFVIPKQVGKV